MPIVNDFVYDAPNILNGISESQMFLFSFVYLIAPNIPAKTNVIAIVSMNILVPNISMIGFNA
jgi:hypothetical protein